MSFALKGKLRPHIFRKLPIKEMVGFIPFSVTKDTKLQDFQYKLVHRILITRLILIFLSLLSEVSIYVEWHLEY
jgi:hypothetical protein